MSANYRISFKQWNDLMHEGGFNGCVADIPSDVDLAGTVYESGNSNQFSLSKIESLGYKIKIWEKSGKRRAYLTNLDNGNKCDYGKSAGYIDLLTNEYICDGCSTAITFPIKEYLVKNA